MSTGEIKIFFINLSKIFVLVNKSQFVMSCTAIPVIVIDVKRLAHKSRSYDSVFDTKVSRHITVYSTGNWLLLKVFP
jgi:hypothetical protein